MRVPRIFVDAHLEPGQPVTLGEQAARHLSTVLRRGEGDAVTLFNGDGYDYPAVIRDAARSSVRAEVTESVASPCESSLSLHLGVGMSRSQKLDLVLQKATELGVTRISPLVCARSVLRLTPEKTGKRLQHWHGILTAACEQCGRARIPELDPPLDVKQWIAQVRADLRIMLDPEGSPLSESMAPPTSIALLNGPEGGLSPEERQCALDCGFVGVRAGPRILRTETAPLVGLSVVQYRWGDLA